MAVVAVWAVLAYLFQSAVQTVKRYESELAQSKNLIAMHDKKIQEQLELLDKMDKVVRELKTAHEVTAMSLAELQQERRRAAYIVHSNKLLIDAQIRKINESNLPQVTKDARKMRILIDGMDGAYRELLNTDCGDADG